MRLLLFSLTAGLILTSFQVDNKERVKLPGEFVKIPAGVFSPNDSSNKVNIAEFYISKFEVSNLLYRTFYNEVAPGLPASEKTAFACDSSGWNQILTYNGPNMNYYHRHPAYNNFPVVNISYEAGISYCNWLKGKIEKDNPGLFIEVRLPSKEEWMWAAMGGRSQAVYPWSNYALRNNKGDKMCNFKSVNDQHIYRNRKTGKPEVADVVGFTDNPIYTTAVKSFTANAYGLYNMCGNVAEMISEKGIAVGGSWNDYGGDVHIRAQSKYERSAPTVGFRPVIILKQKPGSK